jgi:hypothetical protein
LECQTVVTVRQAIPAIETKGEREREGETKRGARRRDKERRQKERERERKGQRKDTQGKQGQVPDSRVSFFVADQQGARGDDHSLLIQHLVGSISIPSVVR